MSPPLAQPSTSDSPTRPPRSGSRLRTALPLLLLLAGSAVWSAGLRGQERPPEPDLSDQRVVMVYEEPRHRLVAEEGPVKVLDVQIQPGDTTLYHTHDSPILYTFISLGDGPADGRVRTITDYLEEPYTHRVSNDGTGLFRILAVAHYGPGVTGSEDDRPDGIERAPQLENPWFRSYRFELAPGAETSLLKHRNPVLVVRATEGRVEVLRDDGFGERLDGIGRWTWQEAETPYRLRNPGDAPVAVVVNEARRAP